MENIKIILNSDALRQELVDIEELARACKLNNFLISRDGSQRSMGADFPPELIIVISFAAGAITAGFFNAIGSDLWENIKQFMKKGADYYEKQNGGQEIYNADIIIDIREEDKSLFQIVIKRGNALKIENSLKVLEKK